MRIGEFGRLSATVTFTADELIIVGNALNEVCNGVRDLDEDDEFATRVGVTRHEARQSLAQVQDLIERMKVPTADVQENAFGWRWANMNYRDHGGDVEWLMREAIRRAVDIRDQGVTTRAVMLVDVLNLLKDAIGMPPEANGIGWLWADPD